MPFSSSGYSGGMLGLKRANDSLCFLARTHSSGSCSTLAKLCKVTSVSLTFMFYCVATVADFAPPKSWSTDTAQTSESTSDEDSAAAKSPKVRVV